MFSGLSSDLVEKSQQVGYALNHITSKPSKWNGKTIVKPLKDMPTAFGEKLWSCNIAFREDADTRVVIHEHLHSRSVSYYKPSDYLKHQALEESSVELFSQEICKANGVTAFSKSYKESADDLRIIRKMLGCYSDDYSFAKDLFEIDMPLRKQWLYDKCPDTQKGNLDNILDRIEKRFEKK